MKGMWREASLHQPHGQRGAEQRCTCQASCWQGENSGTVRMWVCPKGWGEGGCPGQQAQ